jgi:hypothetical protein
MADPVLSHAALRLLGQIHEAGGSLNVPPVPGVDGMSDPLVELRLSRLVSVAPRIEATAPLQVTIKEAGSAYCRNNGRLSGLQPIRDLALFAAYTAEGGRLDLEAWMNERGLNDQQKAALRAMLEHR